MPSLREMLKQRDPDAARLHHQACDSGDRHRGRERRVQSGGSGCDTEAVRSDQAHPVPAADGQQVSAAAAKARRDHDQRVHAAAPALGGHRRTPLLAARR